MAAISLSSTTASTFRQTGVIAVLVQRCSQGFEGRDRFIAVAGQPR